MASKEPPLTSLGTILDHSLKRLDLGTRLDEYGVWPIWNDVVGSTVANNAQPEKIRNGTLFIKVSSPVWMQQLQYMKDLIAEKLNQRLGSSVVKNIFFVVGKIEPIDPAPDSDVNEIKAEPAARMVDQSFLATVRDPEIRQAFERLLKSYARRTPKTAG